MIGVRAEDRHVTTREEIEAVIPQMAARNDDHPIVARGGTRAAPIVWPELPWPNANIEVRGGAHDLRAVRNARIRLAIDATVTVGDSAHIGMARNCVIEAAGRGITMRLGGGNKVTLRNVGGGRVEIHGGDEDQVEIVEDPGMRRQERCRLHAHAATDFTITRRAP